MKTKHSSMKSIGLQVSVIIFGLIASFSPSVAHDATQPAREVLVLNSYNMSLPWSKGLIEGFLSAIDQSFENVKLYIEYMDNNHHPGDLIYPEFEQLLSKKYQHLNIEVILTTDDPALDFILPRRDKLFPGVPIVFCAPNNLKREKIEPYSNITGISETMDFKGTLELILRFHPHVKTIAIVSDRPEVSQQRLNDFYQTAAEFKNRFALKLLTDESLEALKAEISELSPDTAVLFLVFFRDRTGKVSHSNLNVLEFLTDSATVPFYTYKRIDVGHGVVGGMVLSEIFMAEKAMQMVIQILNGATADNIPILYKTPTVPLFDYKKLKQFNIPESKLPPNHQIINKPVSLYAAYPFLVNSVLVIMAALLFFIVLLSANIIRRFIAEKELRKIQVELERRIEDRTQELTRLNETLHTELQERKRMEEERRTWLERVRKQEIAIVTLAKDEVLIADDFETACRRITKISGQALNVERSSIWMFNHERTQISCVDMYEKTPQQHSKGMALYVERYPNYFKFLDAGRAIDAADACSDERTYELTDNYLIPIGIHALLDAPVRISGETIGLISFEHVESIREWTPDEIRFSGEIADQIAHSYMISQQKNAEIALRKSEEKYRNLVENVNDLIYSMDARGCITSINDYGIQLLGYSKDEIIGKPFSDLIHPGNRQTVCDEYQKAIVSKYATRNFEFRMITKEGKEIWVALNSTLMYDENGKFFQDQGIVRNITQQKKLEQHLLHVQKMEAIARLTGGIAHNFNNILMGLQGRITLMMLDASETHPFYGHLKKAENLINDAAFLTRQLLGFTRQEKYNPQATQVNDVIEKTAILFGRTRKEIVIEMELNPELGMIEADRNQIEQVLLNLYINALEAMPQGGTISLHSENIALDQNDAQSYHVKPGNYVKISVSDTGIGMDEATCKRIFDPFFTTKDNYRGAGLGLPAVYGIIQNHSGIITVYSEKGFGTTFNLYFPKIDAKIARETREPEKMLRHGTETILLVDDEDVIIEVAQHMLEHLGYQVVIAKNGHEAISIYEKRHSEIDGVILDMIMPHMGGKETYDRLKKINPNVRVLISSGFNINGKTSEIIANGPNVFIQKPFTLKTLSYKLQELLHS